MKRTAFIQALILVILLAGSWLLLLNRLRQEPMESQSQPEVDNPPAVVASPAGKEAATASDIPAVREAASDLPTVPDDWQEWWDYLDRQPSPSAMRQALQQLKELVFSLPPEQAQTWLLSFIQSSLDMPTGLAFQVGPEGSLTGAASLKAIFLDWLSQLNPQMAASMARDALESTGTRLVPDVFVIHMRNFAKGTTVPATERNRFLRTHFSELLNHAPWMEQPVSAIAEAMDIAVYSGATESVPELVSLMEPGRPQMLRHASALAIERMVDRYPLDTLPALLETMNQPGLEKARAGYFARLRPGSPATRSLLQDYLTASQVSASEREWFLQSFPNLNQSFSHNLLSRNISITESVDHLEWLREALQTVQAWQQDPGMSPYEGELRETTRRLQAQIYGSP